MWHVACREAGGITNLVGVLQQGILDLGADTTKAVVNALLVLAVDDESQAVVTSAGGLPCIVKLLSSDDTVCHSQLLSRSSRKGEFSSVECFVPGPHLPAAAVTLQLPCSLFRQL